MIALGIDLSSQPADTTACLVKAGAGKIVIQEIKERCTDAMLHALHLNADVVAIDAPFGWPLPFVRAVNQWMAVEWTTAFRDELRFRATDWFVRNHFKDRKDKPAVLSVSTDTISLPAMRAMALLQHWGVTDRSGDGRFFEVYPAATLAQWGLPSKGYKGTKKLAPDLRKQIVQGLCTHLPDLEACEKAIACDHALDALVCALTGILAHRGQTHRPNPNDLETAKKEGWIHFPTEAGVRALLA